MSTNFNFSKSINDALADLFSEILFGKESSFQFFKKSNKVLAEQASANSGSGDYYLWLYDVTSQDDRITTFNTEDAQGNVMVFRQPVPTVFSFCLSAPKVSLAEKLEIIDRVNAYFFDNRVMKPIVPKELSKIAPVIAERIARADAQLTLTKDKADPTNTGLFLKFEYKTLYHTGTPIRIDKKVQTRNLQMSQQ